MKSFLKTAVAAALASGVVLAGSAVAQAADVTLRFHHFLSPKGFIVPWAEIVQKDSGGKIAVEVYPSMQLGGKPPSLIDQARDGVVDIVWTIPGYTPGRFPGVEAFELPFVSGQSAEKTSTALWDFYEKHLTEDFKDYKVIALHVHGSGVIHVKNKSVKSLDDMNGLKLRAPTRIANGLLKELGANPVGMPVPAFPEALSKGVVDGGVIPWEVVPPLKVQELATSHTEFKGPNALYNTVFVVAMNKASYDGLSDELKKVIDDNSGAVASAWAGKSMDDGDKPGRALVEKRGNEINTLDVAEIEKWRKAGESVTANWISEMKGKGRDEEVMVKDAMTLIEKYEGQ